MSKLKDGGVVGVINTPLILIELYNIKVPGIVKRIMIYFIMKIF
jgi:hypothetical protein